MNYSNMQINDHMQMDVTMTSGTDNPTTLSGDFLPDSCTTTAFHWWQDHYYPQVIKEAYPVYIQEKSLDKGSKAYEIIKHLKDKKIVNINTAKQFIELMDALIKML